MRRLGTGRNAVRIDGEKAHPTDLRPPRRYRRVGASNQLQSLQAGVSVLADDDVVVHGNPERAGDVDDRLGHLDVGLRGRRIAGGVVVHQDDRGRGQLERALDDLARLDRRVVDRTGLLQLIGNELVALVEQLSFAA